MQTITSAKNESIGKHCNNSHFFSVSCWNLNDFVCELSLINACCWADVIINSLLLCSLEVIHHSPSLLRHHALIIHSKEILFFIFGVSKQ